MPPIVYPYIPKTITVHLGSPDSNAQNVTVNFPDYIKNVASSEIYPTWDEDAIRANIYAQLSFALNRVFTEFYTAQGYDFNITNSTAYDQKFIYGRNIFDNIDRLVDEVFDSYLRRQGTIEPLAAKYCNGTTVTCEGLSQWGSQSLAQQGLDAIQIVRNYYGQDVELVTDVEVRGLMQSYPGTPVRFGDTGQAVRVIQVSLNQIGQDYPAIPKIPEVDGIFGTSTENAVKKFQQIFNLTPDGVVGRATWYKLVYLYTGLLRLSELDSEGHRLYAQSLEYPDAISEGNRGEKVYQLQYLLDVLALFYPQIPQVEQDGIFGPETKNSVIQLQKVFGLTQDGIVGKTTWDVMYDAYKGVVDSTASESDKFLPKLYPYPNNQLSLGSRGNDVRLLQVYINQFARNYPEIQLVPVTGVFSEATRQGVIEVQNFLGLNPDGVAGKNTWDAMTDQLRILYAQTNTLPLQSTGSVLREGSSDGEVGINERQ